MGKKEKAEARAKRRRTQRMKKIVIWIIVIVAVATVVFFLSKATEESNKNRPGDDIPVLSAEHITVGADHEPYNSNPPTSGQHYAQPAGWGVYDEELPDEQLIHNLEHGGIWISYRADLVNEKAAAGLEEIGRQNPGSVIVTPRAENDSVIAVASWGRLMKLDSFDEVRINEFISSNKNRSPEPLAL